MVEEVEGQEEEQEYDDGNDDGEEEEEDEEAEREQEEQEQEAPITTARIGIRGRGLIAQRAVLHCGRIERHPHRDRTCQHAVGQLCRALVEERD